MARSVLPVTHRETLEKEIRELRELLAEKERKLILDRVRGLNTFKYNKHLSNREITRYSRQIFLLNHYKGQVTIREKSVLLIGCGSLGCVCALYLVGAGIGKLTIVDKGLVEETNLHTQLLHSEHDIGTPVVFSAYEKLHRFYTMGDVDQEVLTLENDIRVLRERLDGMEAKLYQMKQGFNPEDSNKYNDLLSTKEIIKYSRQILVPSHNVEGQAALKNASVLLIGAGGLGSPCATYLVAAGIGSLTIVDNDDVEATNLHRQILHSEPTIRLAKVDSAYERLRSINTTVQIIPIQQHLNSTTANEIFTGKKFDVCIDGTDNVATRYLLNDACVLNNIPLVSGSALQLEGQLTVYNYQGGPCYRCIFPKPPPPESVNSCGDSGVLGPSTIGVLQALETIKILTKQPGVLHGRMLTFDGADCSFRNIKLRPKSDACAVCGKNPTIKTYIDYEQFCGAKADDKVDNISILKPEDQVNVNALASLQDKLVIDVRPEIEFNMCHLPNSINIPFDELSKGDRLINEMKSMFQNLNKQNVFVICRRGNDSQRAVLKFNEQMSQQGSSIKFLSVRGGLHAYAKQVDPEFPIY